jgi:hypothetical protein
MEVFVAVLICQVTLLPAPLSVKARVPLFCLLELETRVLPVLHFLSFLIKRQKLKIKI